MKLNKNNVPNLVALATKRLEDLKMNVLTYAREVREKKSAYDDAVKKEERMRNEIDELETFLEIEKDTAEPKEMVKKKYA